MATSQASFQKRDSVLGAVLRTLVERAHGEEEEQGVKPVLCDVCGSCSTVQRFLHDGAMSSSLLCTKRGEGAARVD
jgi:hypothetical protein